MLALVFAVSLAASCDRGRTAPLGDGDADSDSDVDADGDIDGDIDADADLDTEVATGRLVVAESWEVPPFGTHAPSVFTDIFLSPEPRLYLVNDQQQCEVVLSGQAPDFSSSSGTFCALTPGFVLRGWAFHAGRDHIVDAEGHQIVSGSSDRWPLPAAVTEPTGLASDGEALWVADGASRSLHRIELGASGSTRIDCPGTAARSVSWDGSHLWVLEERQVRVIDRDGTERRLLELDVGLSGITVRGGNVYGSALEGSAVYRLEVR